MRPLPFEYAVRNLGRSPLRLASSLIGGALVVALAITAAAFVRGMERSLISSGSARNVILLGAGSEESIERSEIPVAAAGQAAASIRGVKQMLGVPYVSPEVHMALPVSVSQDAPARRGAQAVFRGVTAAAFLVHPQVRLTAGRVFRTGEDEIIVGRLAATRLGLDPQQLAIGKQLRVGDRSWTVVGHFSAPHTVMDAEIWCPLTNLQILTRRDSLSCVVLTMGAGELADAQTFAATRLDLELVAMGEQTYYRKLTDFYGPVRAMVWTTAALIGLGGLFGGLNTMYAAFASRVREVGTLQSLGFRRSAVVLSFVQESMLASAAGALIGVAACLMLIDGTSVRFSMGAFGLHVDGPALLIGLAAGLALGLVGALLPAWNCFRLPITEALKSI